MTDGSVLDDETEVEFARNHSGQFEYTMALMSSALDDSYDPVRSQVEPMFGGSHFFHASDDEKNDPTHEGHFGGKLIIRFPDLDDSEIEASIMKPKASVTVNVVVFPKHGEGTQPYSTIISDDFRVAHEIFAQIGVSLKIQYVPIQLTEEQSNEIYGDNNFNGGA